MNLISLKGVSVRYENSLVLTNVNLDILSEDFIGISGPNGGGKTTLIKAILQLVPYTGEIYYSNGISVKDGSIGYLPQRNNFDRFFPISVKEVIVSGLQSRHRIWGYLNHTYSKKADDLLELTGITRLKHKAIGELSGGEMQKVLLCRALISEPKLLILDEPDNFLDAEFEKELYKILDAVSKRMAIIIVSHDRTNIHRFVKSLLYVDKSVCRI